ncbi:hypothetical protein K8R43_06470 [archaeon]|nr:hypothetical protein [archaeon]
MESSQPITPFEGPSVQIPMIPLALSVIHLLLLGLIIGVTLILAILDDLMLIVYPIILGPLFLFGLLGFGLIFLKRFRAGYIILAIFAAFTFPSGALQVPLINYARENS